MVVRLAVPLLPPGRYSLTVPAAVTASPTLALGALLVKTNKPSLVAGSSSGVVDWIQ